MQVKPPLAKDDIIRILKEHKSELEDKFGIKELGLFGSYVKGEQSENSDVDILVEYKSYDNITLFKLGGLIYYLKELLKNDNVDIAIKKNLNKYYRDNILNETIYV